MNSEFIMNKKDLQQHNQESIETLFALSNGHIGVRASFAIRTQKQENNPGTFINGYYDTSPIIYGEWAYGYANQHQTIVKLADIRGIVLEVDDESSEESDWKIKQNHFGLNMKKGILLEKYHIETQQSKRFTLTIESFASLKQEEIFVSRYTISESNFSGLVTIRKNIMNKKDINSFDNELDPRVAKSKSQLRFQCLDNQIGVVSTENSEKSILLFQVNVINHKTIDTVPFNSHVNLKIEPNQEVSGVNFIGISHIVNALNPSKEEISTFEKVKVSMDFGFLLKEQEKIFAQFWEQSDIIIGDNDELQKGIRFNLFHLFQNAGRNGKTNFAAKGLTGEGYEGHYFWDTEMYLLPFFIYTQPEIAKSLLKYRAHILPQAKERAKILGQKRGALFAWRTINGEEASAYYPAGTAQLHINADISYAFELYEKVTGDSEFLKTVGSDVVFETARFWLSYGSWLKKDTGIKFCINGVTGPDEYTALVNNNYYTNKMAKNNLAYAAELGKRYFHNELAEEIDKWSEASEKMYLPYDNERQLIKQDDTFFEKEVWPFEATPSDKYPLLLHYHPMIIYKYQVCKQADSLLAEMLFPTDYSDDQIKRDYEYYESVTTHDSSLSRSIFSILASRTGQSKKGYSYFMDTALMDLTDLQGNVKDGIHAANMGGSWLSLIYGFAGLKCNYHKEEIIIENHLPKEISFLEFKLKIRDNIIQFKIKNQISAEIIHEGQKIEIQRKDSSICIKL